MQLRKALCFSCRLEIMPVYSTWSCRAFGFLDRLSSLYAILTPQEIKVATMVREGRSSTEIGDVLMITTSAIDFNRKQIRKKLGMTGSSRNLRSHLLSIR